MAVILHIVESFAGGVLTFLAELTEYQAKSHKVYILYGQREHTPSSLAGIFDPRVSLIRSRHFNGAVKTLLNPRSYQEVRYYVKELKPDVVHLHSSAAGFVGRLALRHFGCRLFYTPHGYSFLKLDSPAVLRWCFFAVEHILFDRAVTVACGKGEYEESLKLGSSSAECVCNGIKPESLDCFRKEMPRNERFTVCTSGRIMFQKNPVLFNDLAQRMPECRFIWIGDGDMRDALTASNIEITGWKDRGESLKILSESDAFVMTSLWEGFPIALLEAMYLSKPCIVNNVSGNRDIVKNGESGYICNCTDDFVFALERLNRDEVLRRNMGENARNAVACDYTFDKVADRYEKVYFKHN